MPKRTERKTLAGLLKYARVAGHQASAADVLSAPCGHCGNHVGKAGYCWHGTIECCCCGRRLPARVRNGYPFLWFDPRPFGGDPLRSSVEEDIEWWKQAIPLAVKAVCGSMANAETH